MYAILCTDGVMNLNDVRFECREQKWAPILMYRKEDVITVLLFHTEEMAKRFTMRNLPKSWLKGTVRIEQDSLDWMKGQGWATHVLDYPKKIYNEVDLDVAILEFEDIPDFYKSKGNTPIYV